MAKSLDPVVLELATLSREQIGPFMLLGLDKSADKEQIDKHWADRVKLGAQAAHQGPAAKTSTGRTRSSRTSTGASAPTRPASTPTRRTASSRKLCDRYGVGNGSPGRGCGSRLTTRSRWPTICPRRRCPTADDGPRRHHWSSRRCREELPAVAVLLERLAQLPLDPWAFELRSNDAAAMTPILPGFRSMNDDFLPPADAAGPRKTIRSAPRRFSSCAPR